MKQFQRDNGLKVDGLIRPGGTTESAISHNLVRVSSAGGRNHDDPNQFRGENDHRISDSKHENNEIGFAEKTGISNERDGSIIADFWGNFQDMKEANFIGGDKYFHCKANCQASQRGYMADRLAESMGDIREVYGILRATHDRIEWKIRPQTDLGVMLGIGLRTNPVGTFVPPIAQRTCRKNTNEKSK